MPDNDRSDRWHLDKGIGVAHILTTFSFVLWGIWYLAGQESRISQTELNIKHLQEARISDQASAQRQYDEFRTDLRMINGKLDRLIEYQSRNNNDR